MVIKAHMGWSQAHSMQEPKIQMTKKNVDSMTNLHNSKKWHENIM